MDTLTPPSSPYSPATPPPSVPNGGGGSPHAKHLLIWIVMACVIVSIIVLLFVAFSIQRIGTEPTRKLVQQRPIQAPQTVALESTSLGADIYEKSSNPGQTAVPETNPLQQAQAGPFQDGYQNPFQ